MPLTVGVILSIFYLFLITIVKVPLQKTYKGIQIKESFFPAGFIIEQSNIDLEMMKYYSYKWGVEREQTEKGLFKTSMRVVHTPNIQLGYSSYSHGVMRRGGLPSGAVLLGFVVGVESTAFENSHLHSNELIFIGDGKEMDIISHTKSEMYVMVIEKKLFFNVFHNYFGQSLKEIVENRRFLIQADKAAYFTQGLLRWMKYIQSQSFQLTLLKDYNKIELAIIKHIFDCIVFEVRSKERMKFQVSKVRDLLHENVNKKVTIDQLVEQLDISERQLHDTFKVNYGFSPKKYLQNLRLNAIRKELLSVNPGSMHISEIAFKYGFSHMSHFSSEYKKMFFELPSETFQKR